mgnify:CR=1 FL=1
MSRNEVSDSGHETGWLVNEFGQRIGVPVDWHPAVPPGPVTLAGRWCSVVPLDFAHVPDLYAAFVPGPPGQWTYLTFGPCTSQAEVAEADAEKRGDWSWEVAYSRRPRYDDMVSFQLSFDLPWQRDRRQQTKSFEDNNHAKITHRHCNRRRPCGNGIQTRRRSSANGSTGIGQH